MELTTTPPRARLTARPCLPVRQALRAMRLTTYLLLIACLSAGATGFSQKVTLSVTNAPVQKVFKEVSRQTGVSIMYNESMFEGLAPVTIHVREAGIEEVLSRCFKGQPFSWSIENNAIVVRRRDPLSNEPVIQLPPPIEVRGRVTNENGEPVPGATVQVKGSQTATTTDANGEFTLSNVNADDILVISGAEIKPQEIRVAGRTYITARINAKVGELDQVVMMAYGQTTRRLSTGNIGKVTGEEISKQPVSNPLATLQGRVPGLVVTQTTGIAGGSFTVEIRGRASLDPLLSRNDPLFIIDGVPFEQGNLPFNQTTSAANNPRTTSEGGLSPMNIINPADIESIEILKDADAAAIYGSRGANGVVLITTKKGKSGKTQIGVNAYSGWNKVTRTMDMLNTSEYVAMRKEAFANDGIIPTIANAPDIMVWDTTHFTDFKKEFIGRTAHSSDIQLSLSGGNASTNFLIAVGYHKETNVFSNDLSDTRKSLRFNLNHNSNNQKFKTSLSGSYASDINDLLRTDLSLYFNLIPNIKLRDSLGNLKWSDKGVDYATLGFSNPLAEFEKKYRSESKNLISNFQLSYEIIKNLQLKASLGYNTFVSDETSILPKAARAPTVATLGSATFGNSFTENWIAEPQISYGMSAFGGKIDLLVGSTFQQKKRKSKRIDGTNYANDLLLESVEAAGNVSVSNTASQYRYTAFFGRLTYNWKNRYIINFTTRRDGSSRFGPASRFATFGAGGGAWIFSNTSFIKKHLMFLSYGKVRGSYGITGNDQIGDYSYLDLWNSTIAYQGVPGVVPGSLYNPHYQWEINKKLDVSIDLGFFKDRILFSAAYYRQRSSNQLIAYTLPNMTGFASVATNLPALVENSGWELLLNAKPIFNDVCRWTSSLNLTVPKNRLISFPDLAKSSYSTIFVEGKSLNEIYRFVYTGVDPQTGLYIIKDLNSDGSITSADDKASFGTSDPKFYGGFQNNFSYKAFDLGIFMEFRKQLGQNYLATQFSWRAGTANNQPSIVLERWQKPGDVTAIQKFTTLSTSPAGRAAGPIFGASSATYSDASYLRIKNISIAYNFPKNVLAKLHVESMNIYMHVQNPFVITKYIGSDPETQNLYRLPPLRQLVFGLQTNF